MRGFFWLIEDELAGCSRPGARSMIGWQSGVEAQAALEDDLAWLRERGITAVLSLTETPLEAEALARHDLEGMHLPIPDMTAPTAEQIERALGFVDQQRALGRAVVVHCLAGQGRTGTVLAAYLIRGGMSPQEALSALRAVRPGAVENAAQERALHDFAERRDWIA